MPTKRGKDTGYLSTNKLNRCAKKLPLVSVIVARRFFFLNTMKVLVMQSIFYLILLSEDLNFTLSLLFFFFYKQVYNVHLFFWTSRENHRMTLTAHSGEEDSVRLLLTKNPTRSFSCLWCQVHGISFKLSPRPWQTVVLVSAPIVLTPA